MSPAAGSTSGLSPAQPVPVEYDLLCEQCGYSLLGLLSDRCPECGRPFDPTALPLARVPWLYRARLGAVGGYVKTLWLILTRPGVFATEMSRPVRISHSDARAFRRITLRLVLLAYLIAVTAAAAYGLRELTRWRMLPPVELLMPAAVASAVGAAIGGLGVLIAFAMATDLPTFIWRGLPSSPDDLAPLHYYACAPLALTPLLVLLCGGALAAYDAFGGTALDAAVGTLIAVIASVFVLLVWWIPPLLMRSATHCGLARTLALAAYLPLHWAMMLYLGAMVGLVGMMVSTAPLKALQ